MNQLRWALSVLVIVMPLYGMFSGAADTSEDAGLRASSCHNFAAVKTMIDGKWPDLHFRSGLTLVDRDGITLTFYNQGGQVYVVGQNTLGMTQTKWPCVRNDDGDSITMSSPDGVYTVARNGKQYGAGIFDKDGNIVAGTGHVFSVANPPGAAR